MPTTPFPERPDSGRLFARNEVIEAMLPLARLPRFARCLQESSGEVAVHLVFGHDADGRRSLRGSLEIPASVLCQRCLQPMDLVLKSAIDLVVVDDDATREALEANHALAADIVVDEHDDLDVLALIEDELLLSLPSVPMHEEQDCSPVLNRLRQDADGEGKGKGKESQTANPFAALAALRKAGTDGSSGSNE